MGRSRLRHGGRVEHLPSRSLAEGGVGLVRYSHLCHEVVQRCLLAEEIRFHLIDLRNYLIELDEVYELAFLKV